MLARSLIVLLVVLNAGVAIWWLARGDAAPVPAETALPGGVARLQLVGEAGPAAEAAPPPTPAPPPVAAADEPPAPDGASAAPPAPVADASPAPDAAALQCYALGPFTDAGKLAAAQRALQPRVARLHVREAPSTTRADWRVWLPPQADRAAAQALVERIVAAGFSDYYIIASGEQANSIALGLYGSEASARRRQSALRAAGFTDVQAEAVGDAPPATRWIDVASNAPLAAADGRALGAGRVEPLDCAGVPATPATAAR
ncbi:SPOR domain-containing protein [Luteimonas lutimaris]|uniref:SPOR domain-containing protein n=1 Tax=Luteimonas lutimaris TaxID=698645 RepID=A0ABP7M5I7_9GAMM